MDNYRRQKENIRRKCSQLDNIERNILIEHDKKIGIDEIIRQNERINNNSKSPV